MLLNSATELSEGTIVACDARRGLIGRTEHSQPLVWSEKKIEGLRSDIREPVAILASAGLIFVADWRGQRILICDEKFNLIFQIKNSLWSFFQGGDGVRSLVRYLTLKGTFIGSHFLEERQVASPLRLGPLQSVRVLSELVYDRNCIRKKIKKPNGFAFGGYGNNQLLFFTDKDTSSVTAIRIRKTDTPTVLGTVSLEGRLGNLALCGDRLFVCSETTNRIYVLDLELRVVRTIQTPTPPFGAAEFEGAMYFCSYNHVYSLSDEGLISVSDCDGSELHGLFSANGKLYGVDRLNGTLKHVCG